MERKKLYIKIILVFIIMLLSFSTKSNASLELNDLNFKVNVKNNGDIDITEKWDIEIEDTNTLFKTFNKNGSYDYIENVSVKEIFDDESSKDFIQSNEYKYHVNQGNFQALENPDGKFEIAWGVNVTGIQTNTYEIKYTVKNAVKVYNDCADFYWQLVGSDFEVYSKNVSGTVTIPTGITNVEDLRIWAHGPLNGTINKVNNNTVEFSVKDLPSKTFLEVRIVTPKTIFPNSTKIYSEDKLDSILATEQKYADDANKKREQQALIQKALYWVGNVISGIIIIFLIIGIKKKKDLLKKFPKLKPSTDWKYYRELPDNFSSPAEATRMLNVCIESHSLAGIMMDLCLKKWIEFEIKSKKKEDMIIHIKNDGDKLTEDEKEFYNYLCSINKDHFSMKDFEKKGTRQPEKFYNMKNKMDEKVKTALEEKGFFDEERSKVFEKEILFLVLDIVLMLGSFAILFIFFGCLLASTILFFVCLINLVYCIKVMVNTGDKTQQGIDMKTKWNGFKNFMQDFSKLNEREIPELALWEHYLVYATAFGIANKVIKQLKVKYPQMMDDDYLMNNYTLMYIACNNDFGSSFVSNMSTSMGSVTNYSSGSGAGGGFSSGGGFGGRRRRRWRPLK